MKIFWSVGHDAIKRGAVNKNYDPPFVEYDILVELTQYCFEEAIALGISSEKVWSDRLRDAVEEINEKSRLNDVAIETHINSFSDTSVNGCETLYKVNSEKGKELAKDIQNSLCAHLLLKNRGVKDRDNLYFLNATKCTSVITEPFFISNEQEVRKFLINNREKNLRNIAYSIVIGVKDYINKNYGE